MGCSAETVGSIGRLGDLAARLRRRQRSPLAVQPIAVAAVAVDDADQESRDRRLPDRGAMSGFGRTARR